MSHLQLQRSCNITCAKRKYHCCKKQQYHARIRAYHLHCRCGSCSVFEVAHIVYKYALSQLSLLLAMNQHFDKAQERAAFTSRSVLFVRDCLGKWLLRCNLPNSAVKLFFALFLNNLLTVIISAFGTYLVALDQFVALGALGETGCFEFPVCKTRIRFGFRHFIFRYCHLLTSDIFATFAYTAF